MKYLSLLVIIFLTGGCAIGPGPVKRFISPAQADYDRADLYFQKKNYAAAIAGFEKFIKDYPRSNLVPGAYLGVGWSHYLKNEYKETLDALAQVRTQDQGLKSWIDKLQTEAKKRIGQAATETSASTLFNIPSFTNQEKLKIEGTAPLGGKVLVNNQEAVITEGIFSKEIALNEGENNITIVITDKEGKTGTKESRVVLDKTNPQIKITSAELDDFGYAQIKGVTEPGAQLSVDGQLFAVDEQGSFNGSIKWPNNKQVPLTAIDRAGNITKEVFSDTDYPARPTGLRVRSQSGINVDLAWNDNLEPDLKGYNVYYSSTGEFSDKKNNREIITGAVYSMTELRSGRTYTVYLRAVDKMGNESEGSTPAITIVIP